MSENDRLRQATEGHSQGASRGGATVAYAQMKKTRKRKPTAQPDTASIGRFVPVDLATKFEPYGHPPRGSRLVAELEQLLLTPDIFASPIRDKAKWYLSRLKDAYSLPRWYRFYPRDHVPAGGEPYDEEFVRREYFGTISLGAPGQFITPASGFASFKPEDGVFSIVGYSMGSTADVEAGAIVTMETNQHKTDIWLTANYLLDYQYQLSASLNPAFTAATSATEEISVTLDLLMDIDIRTMSGVQLSIARTLKRIKHAKLMPGSTLPPFIAGTEEIVPGNQLQGSEFAIPISWDYTFQAPANCRVRVSVFVAPFVTATGYKGSKDYRHLGIADGRASGQITSVQATLFV
jgi:hypothetical protein